MYEFEYMQKLTDLLQVVHDTNKDEIKKLARVFADCIKNDKMIHSTTTPREDVRTTYINRDEWLRSFNQ